MAYVITHELDFGDLEYLKHLCVRTRDNEGHSERYWLARTWLDREVQRLNAQRFQDTCGVVAAMGKRLRAFNEHELKPQLVRNGL